MSKDSGPLNDEKRNEIRRWLVRLNFLQLPLPERAILETSRRELLKCIDPTIKTYNRGQSLAELTRIFMAILAYFEIDERIARQTVDAELAQGIGALLNLAKGMVLIGGNVKTEQLKTTRPAAKFFVEYYTIYGMMIEAGQRQIIAQAALLAMQVDEIKPTNERLEFIKLHQELLQLSRSITRKDKGLRFNQYAPLATFTIVLGKFQITDEEIRETGAESIIETAKLMRKLLK